MKRLLQIVTLILVPALVICALPAGAFAQDAASIDPVVANSDDSGDETTQNILVGLFVVVVAVVFYLGFKNDFGRKKASRRAELEEAYEEYAREDPFPAVAVPELTPVEEELVQAAEEVSRKK